MRFSVHFVLMRTILRSFGFKLCEKQAWTVKTPRQKLVSKNNFIKWNKGGKNSQIENFCFSQFLFWSNFCFHCRRRIKNLENFRCKLKSVCHMLWNHVTWICNQKEKYKNWQAALVNLLACVVLDVNGKYVDVDAKRATTRAEKTEQMKGERRIQSYSWFMYIMTVMLPALNFLY